MVIIKTDKPEDAINILKENGVDLISSVDVHNL